MNTSWNATDKLIWTKDDNRSPIFLRDRNNPGDAISHYFENQNGQYEAWVSGRPPQVFASEREAQIYLLDLAI